MRSPSMDKACARLQVNRKQSRPCGQVPLACMKVPQDRNPGVVITWQTETKPTNNRLTKDPEAERVAGREQVPVLARELAADQAASVRKPTTCRRKSPWPPQSAARSAVPSAA